MRKIKKDYLCIGLAVIISLGVAFGNYKVDKMIAEQEVKQEEVVEQKEQEVIEDESLNKEIRNGEYQLEDKNKEKTDINELYDLTKQILDENISNKEEGGFDYTVEIVGDDTIMFITDIPSEVVAEAITSGIWNELVEQGMELCEQTVDAYRRLGNDNVHFSLMIGDKSIDKVYLAILDDMIVYNVANEMN